MLAAAGVAAADVAPLSVEAGCCVSLADVAGAAAVLGALLLVCPAVRSVGAAVAMSLVEAGAVVAGSLAVEVEAVSLAFVVVEASATVVLGVAVGAAEPVVVVDASDAGAVAAVDVIRGAVSAGAADALMASVLLLVGLSVLSAGLVLAAACLSLDLISVVAAATVIGFTVAALLLLVAGSSSVDLFAFLLLEIGFCFVPLGCFRCGAVALPLPTTSEKGVKPGATDGACWVAAGKLPGVKLAFGLLVG